jgi:hypothetical protein
MTLVGEWSNLKNDLTVVQHRRHVWAQAGPQYPVLVTVPEINCLYAVGSRNIKEERSRGME